MTDMEKAVAAGRDILRSHFQIWMSDVALRAAIMAALPHLTYTDVCKNAKCPRGGLPLEVLTHHIHEGHKP